jgi:hypothetical protein
MYHIGKWNDILSSNDVEKIWSELHRIVSKHKLARLDAKRNGVYQQGKYDFYTDLTQELFTVLLAKDRFNYYLANEMSDVEVEMEITQIELTNMLNKQIRSRFPESFRISRRISQILKTSDRFKRYDTTKNLRHGSKMYGLKAWEEYYPKQLGTVTDEYLHEAISSVRSVKRDLRYTGATGDTQIIISNKELEALIAKILDTVDNALSIKQLRAAVLSKLPIMDISILHISDYRSKENEDEEAFELEDTRLNPEQLYIEKDFESTLNAKVDLLFANLKENVRSKIDKEKLMLNVLWYTYFDAAKPNQYAISKLLRVSDATIHNYRKVIDQELRRLKLNTVEEGLKFQQVLRTRLDKTLSILNSYKVMGE